MRPSQIFFCSGVAPTVIGSLPRNVASTAVATPRSIRAISSQMQVDIKGAPAHAAVLFRDKQQLNAQLVRAAHVPHDLRSGIRRGHRDPISSWSGSRFLANSLSDFKLSFKVLLVIIADTSISQKRFAFRGLCWSVPAGTPGCRRRSRHPPPERWELWGSC